MIEVTWLHELDPVRKSSRQTMKCNHTASCKDTNTTEILFLTKLCPLQRFAEDEVCHDPLIPCPIVIIVVQILSQLSPKEKHLRTF